MTTTVSLPVPPSAPTMYFLGVSTRGSFINRLFPAWADALGLKGAVLEGIDLPIGGPSEVYRAAVQFIADQPLACGALVTTHKIDVYRHAADLFDGFDEHAQTLGEVGCIARHEGRLIGHSKDPLTAALALADLAPATHWQRNAGAQALILGAGGAGLAIVTGLLAPTQGQGPARIHLAERDTARLENARARLGADERLALHAVANAGDADRLLMALPPASLVVNATGLGKDRPGSPLGDGAMFPQDGLVWELNYRGPLDFLAQARGQERTRSLTVRDGWFYFLHGWSQAIAEVFHLPLDGERFTALAHIAQTLR